MAKLTSMIIHTAYLKKFSNLSDAEFGQLIRIMLIYYDSDKIPNITNPKVSLAFDFVKYEIDESREKYFETVEKRRIAGAQGGKQKQANIEKAKANNAGTNNAGKLSDALSILR